MFESADNKQYILHVDNSVIFLRFKQTWIPYHIVLDLLGTSCNSQSNSKMRKMWRTFLSSNTLKVWNVVQSVCGPSIAFVKLVPVVAVHGQLDNLSGQSNYLLFM